MNQHIANYTYCKWQNKSHSGTSKTGFASWSIGGQSPSFGNYSLGLKSSYKDRTFYYI